MSRTGPTFRPFSDLLLKRRWRLPLLVAVVCLFALALPSELLLAQTSSPIIESVAITSDPGDDGGYGIGDMIEVGVTFDRDVSVSGTPQISLDIGADRRVISYSSTDARQVLFSYTVVADDWDDDGIEVVANSLMLNGSSIFAALDLATAAELDHSSLHATDHLVDGVIPTVEISFTHRFVRPEFSFDALLTFSEPAFELTAADLAVTNGTASDAAVLPATSEQPLNTRWHVSIRPIERGPLTIVLPAAAAADAYGNGNAVSNVLNLVAATPTRVNVAAVTSGILEGGTAEFRLWRFRGRGALTIQISVDEAGYFVSSSEKASVSRAGQPDNPVEFKVTSTPFTWNVIFEEDELIKTVRIPTTDDLIDEPDGSITVAVLENPGNYEYAGGWFPEATSVVLDDDPSVEVAVEWFPPVNTQKVAEGRDAVFIVTRSYDNGLNTKVNAELTTVGDYLDIDGAGENKGYELETDGADGRIELTFPPGVLIKTILVPTVENDVEEDDGSITFEVLEAPGSHYSPDADSAVATAPIADDDFPPPLAIYALENIITEGEQAGFLIARTGRLALAAPGSVTVDLELRQTGDYLSDSTPLAAGNSGPVTHTVTLEEDEQNLTVFLDTEDDDAAEKDATLTARILPAGDDRYDLTAANSATLFIRDNDPAELKITAVDGEITEGSDATFKLTRLGYGFRDLEVGLYISGHEKIMTAATKGKVENSEAADKTFDTTITFPRGTDEATVVLTTEADTVNEGDGVVTLEIGRSILGSYHVPDPASASILVKDDDIPTVTFTKPTMPTGAALSDSGDTWEGSMIEGGSIVFGVECTGGFEFTDEPDDMRHNIVWESQMDHPAYYGTEFESNFGNNYVRTNQFFKNCTSDLSQPNFLRSQRYTGPDGGEVRITLTPSDELTPQLLANLKMKSDAAKKDAETEGTSVKELGIFAVVPETFSVPCADELRFCPRYEVGEPGAIKITVENQDPVILIKTEKDQINEGEDANFVLDRIWGDESVNNPDSDIASTDVYLRVTAPRRFISRGAFPDKITFGKGETSKVLSLETIDDRYVTPNGSVTVEILPDTSDVDTNTGGKYSTFAEYDGHTVEGNRSDQATMVILDDDVTPNFWFADSSVLESASVMEFVASLTSARNREVTIRWSTSDVTAVAGSDYSSTSASDIVFAAGETEKTVTIPITSDTDDEADETFEVKAVSAVGLTLEGNDFDAAVGTILDDDLPEVNVKAKNETVYEGEQVVFVLSRVGYLGEQLEVTFRYGTAQSSEVVSATFAKNKNTVEFSADTTDDDEVNTLSRRVHVVELFGDSVDGEDMVWEPGTPAEASVYVLDDDSPPWVGIRAKEPRVEEGQPAVFRFSRLGGDLREGLRITVRYSDPEGESRKQVTFPAHDRTVEVSYSTTDDTDVNAADTERTYSVSLHGDQSSGMEIDKPWRARSPSSAAVTLFDNDQSVGLSLSATAPTRVGPTPFRRSVTYTVTNIGDSAIQGSITVNSFGRTNAGCEIAGPLDADSNAMCQGSILIIPADITAGQIQFTARASSGTTISNQVSIDIEASVTPLISFRETSIEVQEGPNAEAELTVELTALSRRGLTVDYAVRPSGRNPATPGDDYDDVSGTLTFSASGSATMTIPITINEDDLDEFRERFSVELSNPQNGDLDPDKFRATVVILDDPNEVLPTVTLSRRGTGPVDERVGMITFVAKLDRVSGKPVVLGVSDPAGGTATAGADYADFDQVLTIRPGELMATFQVEVYQDEEYEEDETFNVGIALASVTGGATAKLGNPAQRTITIEDHTTSISIALNTSPERISESAGETTVEVTAKLNTDPFDSETTIHVEIGEDSKAKSTDFSGLDPFDIVIPAESAEHTVEISLTLVDDDLDENPESINLVGTINAGDSDAAPPAVLPASITIVDDDTKGVTLSKNALAVEEEGAKDAYTVVLDSQPFGTVTIDLEIQGGQHLAVLPTHLEFTKENWDTKRRVRVSAKEDGDTDPATNAAATIIHTASGGRYGDVTIENATVTIKETKPKILVSNARASEDAGFIEFTVSMTASYATSTVSLTYNTADETALADEDYISVSDQTLTFMAGETEKVIRIALIDDTLDEPNETFLLKVTESSELVDLAGGEASLNGKGIITDNDKAPVLSNFDSENLIYVSESAVEVSIVLEMDSASKKPGLCAV